ncbi:MAG: hypothetical protein PHR82_03875 [Endomicrobiaceae bacterium]|nr:hypothetical protein [Endomicrobiaceae bacterium]
MKKIIVLLSLLIITTNIFAFEQSFEPQTDLTVGDKATLKIKADGLTIDNLEEDKLNSLNFGDFELLDIQQGQNGEINFIVSAYKAGKVELLSADIPYTVNGDLKFVKTKALPVEIKSVLDPKKPSQDIYDIKGIFKFGHGILWYLKIILIVLAILILTYFIYRYFKKKTKKITQEEFIRSIPPKEYALSQLENLKTLGLIEKGQIKEYYDKLSDILRFYVSRVYNIEGMEKTTSEFYLLLKEKAPSDFNRQLKEYLGNCDFVKFAKVIPTQENIDEDYQKAKEFINRI